MSLNLGLWIAMAGAALFFHYAGRHKAPTAIYVLLSVSISALAMVLSDSDWPSVLVGQLLLFAAIEIFRRIRK